jgi:hypothetical protein
MFHRLPWVGPGKFLRLWNGTFQNLQPDTIDEDSSLGADLSLHLTWYCGLSQANRGGDPEGSDAEGEGPITLVSLPMELLAPAPLRICLWTVGPFSPPHLKVLPPRSFSPPGPIEVQGSPKTCTFNFACVWTVQMSMSCDLPG